MHLMEGMTNMQTVELKFRKVVFFSGENIHAKIFEGDLEKSVFSTKNMSFISSDQSSKSQQLHIFTLAVFR